MATPATNGAVGNGTNGPIGSPASAGPGRAVPAAGPIADDDELERLVLAAEKRTRGFLPLPPSLRDRLSPSERIPPLPPSKGSATSLTGSTSEPTSPTQGGHGHGSKQHSEEEQAAAAKALEERRAVARARAEARCLQSVPRLRPWLSRVSHAIEDADAAEERVESIRVRMDTLAGITAKVHRHSDAISANASALMARKAQLERSLATIASAMRHFNRVDELMTEVSLPDLSAASQRFPELLADLEDTAEYLARVQHYKSAKTYSSRLSMAYQRAMMCLRDAIVNRVADAVNGVMSSTQYIALFRDPKNAPVQPPQQAQQQGAAVTTPAADPEAGAANSASPSSQRPQRLSDALELVNSLFFAQLESLQPQLRMLEARCDAPEAEVFVRDTFSAYSEHRARFVTPLLNEYSAPGTPDPVVVAAGAASPSAEHPETDHIRLLLRNVGDATAAERELFDRVWLSEDVPENAFDAIASDVADAAYQMYRAALLRTDDLGDLARMCQALYAFLGTGPERNSDAQGSKHHHHHHHGHQQADQNGQSLERKAVAQVAPTVKRMLQDAQERVVFRTSLYIRHRVNTFPYSGDQLWRLCSAAAEAAHKAAEEKQKQQEEQHGASAEDSNAAGDSSTFIDADTSAPPAAVIAAVENAEAKAAAEPAGMATAAASTSMDSVASPTIPATPVTVAAAAAASEHDGFVPLDRSVYLLDLLYPAVSGGVFAVFADECVHTTVELLLKAAKSIKQYGELATSAAAQQAAAAVTAQGSKAAPQAVAAAAVAPMLPQLYSRLFLVRHLLRLREALAPYDVNLTIVEKGLNLSSLVERKLELFQRSRESKRDVETELRVACESAIATMSQLVTKPVSDATQKFPGGSADAADVSDHVSAAVLASAAVAQAVRLDLDGFIRAAATRGIIWGPVRQAAGNAVSLLEDKAKELHPDFVAPRDAAAALAGI